MSIGIKKSKTVYLVRHGESVDNISPVFQAENSPLSENGQRQARFIANRVSHLQFDKIIASPLVRTRQTAAAIADACGNEVEFSDLFVERIKPKSISGKPFSDEVASKTWHEWEESFYKDGDGIEGAENYTRILNRASDALNYLLDKDEDSILVVTHGYFLRVLVTRVLLGDELLSPQSFESVMKAMNMENTGLTILKYTGAYNQGYRWRLWVHNDHAHLAE